MSFGGPIDSMINSQKENKRLMQKKKRLKEIQSRFKIRKKKEPKYHELSESERASFQLLLDKRASDSRRKQIIIFILSLLILLLLLFLLSMGDYSSILEVLD